VEEILGCRAAAEKKQGAVPFTWKGPFRTEIWAKCAVRRGAKHWPRTTRLAEVMEVMDRADPMDFTEEKPAPAPKAEKPAGPSVEDQLRQALTEGGVPEAEHAKWLTGIAGAMGKSKAADIPPAGAKDAVRRITERVKKWQDAQAAKAATQEKAG